MAQRELGNENIQISLLDYFDTKESTLTKDTIISSASDRSFNSISIDDIKITLNYIGSKYSLLDFIDYVTSKEINHPIGVFGDLFAGTGIVGLHFKKKGCKIISNDIQFYSYLINQKYIGINSKLTFNGLNGEIDNLYQFENRILGVTEFLNNLSERKEGFIFKEYAQGGTESKEISRMYFSDENALKIDTIRMKIQEWLNHNQITVSEYYYLVGTLVEAADKVANTASVYGAFLKKLKKSAQKELKLAPTPVVINNYENIILNEDIVDILDQYTFDVLYLDPPYNHRQYATNYHMLETIAKYDNPEIHGKTGLREYEHQKSKFCLKNKVLDEFKKVVKKARANYILLSYNNEGLMSIEDVQKALSCRGSPRTYILKYKRFKADKTENRNHKDDKTYEYLHFVKCEYNREMPENINPEIIYIDKDTILR